MATYIGTKYRVENSTGGKDLHYLLTHAKAVLTETYTPGAGVTTDKQFVSSSQLDFITALSDGTAEVPSISDLETRIVNIEGLVFGEDADTTINKLTEIIAFLNSASITEGMTLPQFVENVARKITLNGTAIASGNTATFYAPSTGGATNTVLQGGGATTMPVWKSGLTIENVTATGDIQAPLINNFKVGGNSIGNYLKSHVVQEVAPTAADYGRDVIPIGSVWLDTGSVVVPPPTATTYRLYLETSSGINLGNDLLGWARDNYDHITNVLTLNGGHTLISNSSSEAVIYISLLSISTTDGIYEVKLYCTPPNEQSSERKKDIFITGSIKGLPGGTVLIDISAPVYQGSPEQPVFSEVFGVTEPNKILLPQGQILVNNLHLLPPKVSMFKITLEMD